MIITCPLCHQDCETDSEIEVGQRVQCPFCDGKFTYGEDAHVAEGSVIDLLSKLKYIVYIAGIGALLTFVCYAIWSCSSKQISVPTLKDIVTDLRLDAEQEDEDAQFTLATLHLMRTRYTIMGTWHIPHEEISEAIYWYGKAAENGDLPALNALGVCYYILAEEYSSFGDEIIAKRNAAYKARDAFTRCGLGGNYPAALYNLAMTYGALADSIGLQSDLRQMSTLLHRAADNGNADAQEFLAMAYDSGVGRFAKDKNAAKRFEEAAEASNLAYAKGNYAKFKRGFSRGTYMMDYECIISKEEDVIKSREKAEKGDVYAQFALGKWYSDKSKVESAKWYQKAANQGNPVAQYEIGRCYYHGDGVKQDLSKAFNWFNLAAVEGNKDAQEYLGICYYVGLGVRKDKQEAIKWLRESVYRPIKGLEYPLR